MASLMTNDDLLHQLRSLQMDEEESDGGLEINLSGCVNLREASD